MTDVPAQNSTARCGSGPDTTGTEEPPLLPNVAVASFLTTDGAISFLLPSRRNTDTAAPSHDPRVPPPQTLLGPPTLSSDFTGSLQLLWKSAGADQMRQADCLLRA